MSRRGAELAVPCELRRLQHHADLQTAGRLQGQSRVALVGEALAEGSQQLTTVGVVERQTAELVVQESAHSLRHLNHKHTGLDVVVQQLIRATVKTERPQVKG